MRRCPGFALLVGVCVGACGQSTSPGNKPAATPAEPIVTAAPVRVSSWNDIRLVGAVSPAQPPALPVHTRILARRELPLRVDHGVAWVLSSEDLRFRVRFASGGPMLIPRAAVVPTRGAPTETFVPGDLVFHRGKAMVFARNHDRLHAFVRELDEPSRTHRVRVAYLAGIMRTDRFLHRRLDATTLRAGDRVLAKWDARSWWVGTVARRQGEALLVRYDDHSTKWLPLDFAIRLSRVRPGVPVMGVNKRDGQPVPGTLLAITPKTADIRYFDGRVETIPLSRLAAFVDQLGLDYGDPCKRHPGPDPRLAARTLRSWLTPRIHYYVPAASPAVATSPTQLELAFVLYSPSDRQPRRDWKRLLELLAEQVRSFLQLELPGVKVDARVHAQPVVSTHTLTWLKTNLRESDAWHVWQPTGESVRQVFPNGPVAGRHRVVVVIPDAPGISTDSSGVERQLGFVRANGSWFEKLTEAGLLAVTKGTVARTSFHQWREDFLATTLAHEVLHTIGLPHTDGDPWSVMNIGPWYPITRPEIHIAAHHKLMLRSPFSSHALSQGYAEFLINRDATYLDAISQRYRLDTGLALHYGAGPGHFHLGNTMGAFAPNARLVRGERVHTGERAIVRAYLASFIHFYVDTFGAAALKSLLAVPNNKVREAAARAAGTSRALLEKRWHRWLDLELGKRRGRMATLPHK